MSYRTLKRLLGETNLERKCMFLFGGGLFLLISSSFFVYSKLNSRIVDEASKRTARSHFYPIMLEKHWKESISGDETQFDRVIDDLVKTIKPPDLENFKFIKDATAESRNRAADLSETDALERLKKKEVTEVVNTLEAKGEYQYYMPVYAEASCMRCHGLPNRDPNVKQGELLGVMKIVLPLDATRQAFARNNAILIAAAIITAALAMLAAYAIVRYIIVKPVMHLKEVSDEIARGTLDLRADIRTGDEFEELSHAFNRMLRHLVTVQDELREVNTDLDAKVDQLAQKNMRLYEMTKLKDEFLATMSHELRTPLNSILGFGEVLAGSPNLTEKQKRFVHNIQISGNNLMVMINDLLDLAKIESGKMEIGAVEFSLTDLVERQIGSLAPLAEKKNIDLSSEIDQEMPMLMQDPTKLQQILSNLLSNAIKFTPEGGRVKVRAARADENTLELVVEDTGIGIPLEEQETVFEKFRQLQTAPGQRDAMTREYGGTGLGLSIVKEMSKLLGGEVLLVSEFGKGSTFTVRLPLRLDDAPGRIDSTLAGQIVGLNRVSTKLLEAAHKQALGAAARSTEQAGEPAA